MFAYRQQLKNLKLFVLFNPYIQFWSPVLLEFRPDPGLSHLWVPGRGRGRGHHTEGRVSKQGTYSPTAITFPLTHLTTYPPKHLPTYPLTHLTTYPPNHIPTYPQYSPTHLPTYPLTHLTTYPPNHIPI